MQCGDDIIHLTQGVILWNRISTSVPKAEFTFGRLVGKGKRSNGLRQALGRNLSTIWRELNRNTYANCHMYAYYWAQQIAQARKSWTNPQKSRKLTDGRAPITKLLQDYLSSELVSGYMNQHHTSRLSR